MSSGLPGLSSLAILAAPALLRELASRLETRPAADVAGELVRLVLPHLSSEDVSRLAQLLPHVAVNLSHENAQRRAGVRHVQELNVGTQHETATSR